MVAVDFLFSSACTFSEADAWAVTADTDMEKRKSVHRRSLCADIQFLEQEMVQVMSIVRI
ncbi:MAG: hypothetical protein AB1442_10930 [Nitrospirota bacterium]